MFAKEFYTKNQSRFLREPKFKHKEHIIQNAIGGRLKSDQVLCEACGNLLNEQVDSFFVRILSPFTEKLKHKIARDRETKGTTKVGGYHIPTKREILFSEGKAYPKRPAYDLIQAEKKILIYCSKGAIIDYRKHVQSTLIKDGIDWDQYAIVEITEFDNDQNIGLFFSEGVVDFNKKWKFGLIKIATEFAYLNGVERNHLSSVLDTQKNELIFTNNVFPFFPIGPFDAVYEHNRVNIERNYPTHTLILFCQTSETGVISLVCYIDLLSTFQYYVILDEDYKGTPLFKCYHQKLDKEDKPDIDLSNYDYKDLSILINDYNIDLDKYRGTSNDELIQYIRDEIQKIPHTYELNIGEELYHVISQMTQAFLLSKGDNYSSSFQLQSSIEFFKQMGGEFGVNFMFNVRNLLNSNETVRIDRYRQEFIEDGEHLSTPFEIWDMLQKRPDHNDIKTYGHMKFGHLSYYVGKEMKDTESKTF
ncbi:hypothetical protein WSM22_20040 [Cytophagales bacterium WSM2-2]|nr:hypothetical protein WSM22_20040 [Cytophagales bacterium WSM2-2]